MIQIIRVIKLEHISERFVHILPVVGVEEMQQNRKVDTKNDKTKDIMDVVRKYNI